MKKRISYLENFVVNYFNLIWGSLELFIRRAKIVLVGLIETFLELFILFVTIVLTGGIGYTLFEGISLAEGLWWAIMTAFTIGYGDIQPETLGAKLIGSMLMTISIFVIVPLITARLAAKMISHDRRLEKVYEQIDNKVSRKKG